MAPLKCLALVVLGAVACSADMGNWTVENCIVVRMDAELTIQPVFNNNSVVVGVPIPVGAVATGECNKNDQRLSLSWKVNEVNTTDKMLNRNLTVYFIRNDTSTPPVYGVNKIEGVYETKHFIKMVNVTDPDTNVTTSTNESFIQYVSFTSFTLSPVEFPTPVNRSYLCLDVGVVSMHAELHDTSETGGGSGEKLNNANFTAKNVHFDAFRPTDYNPNFLQTPLDCDFKPSDVVPIVVGCALAGTVLLVLIAYLVGRRRNRARGYQSV